MTSLHPTPHPHRRPDRGYILITLILFVALIAIAAVVMAPVIAFQVKRDREEELIHRGVQYSRAMKHFVKKFGRYPTRIEELENTNQVRFLRRRYKDPITGKDFKILRMGDVQMAFGAGIAGAVPAGGLNAGAPGAPGAPGTPGTPGAPGGLGGPNGAMNTVAMAGGLAAAAGMNAGNPAQGPGISAPGAATVATQNAGQDADENSDEDATPGAPKPGASPAAGAPGTPGAPGAFGTGPALRSSAADRWLEWPVQARKSPSAYLTRKTTTISGNLFTIRAAIAVDFSPPPTKCSRECKAPRA